MDSADDDRRRIYEVERDAIKNVVLK